MYLIQQINLLKMILKF